MRCVIITVKEEQGNAVFAVHFTVKPFNQLYIINNMEQFSFKSACAASAHCIAYEDRLACSVTVRIPA